MQFNLASGPWGFETMVKTPGWLADQVMKQATTTTLVSRDDLGENLIELVFQADSYRTATTLPGDVTSFRISRTDFRHYTPARVDPDSGELTIIVQRHGHGPGEELILSWAPGVQVQVCRWASKRNFRYEDATTPIFLVGDATVISLAMAFSDRCAADGRAFSALLEVGGGDVEATRKLVPGAEVVMRTANPGETIDAWLRERATDIDPDSTIYLAGHGQSIQRQRVIWRETTGLDRKAIKTQPFWADGKTGL